MTKRPVSPGAEDLLGLYFPVLDHGFVSLVDYMGTDACIERAARVSYGYGTRQTSQTRGLIRYLRRHLHTTPSEMVEFKFHCCMPMFVARQWIRHRSACLAGDARLWFDLPSALRRGRRQRHSISIAKFHRMWHQGSRHPIFKKKPLYLERVDERKNLKRARLRSVDEETGEIIHTRVMDVWESGSKPVFRVTLENGYSLTMSKDHRCLTDRGWLTLERATNLKLGIRGAVSWDGFAPALAVNGRKAYHDPEWLKARRSEGLNLDQIAELAGTSRHNVRKCLKTYGLSYTSQERSRLVIHTDNLELELMSAVAQREPLYSFFDGKNRLPRPSDKKRPRTIRKVRGYSKIAKIEYAGEQMTYDVEVAGPFHNFVANGFVVHNSVNEYSGRYSLMPMLFHLPTPDQIQTQSRSNNQGRSGTAVSAATYEEALRRWQSIRSQSRDTYEWLTGQDVARELARIDLPLSTYTQWYWKIDLHNLLHFLTLRVDRHAQWEIQEYGRVIAGMLKRAAPLSYEAWIDFDVCGARLSRMELDSLRRLVARKSDGLEARSGVALEANDLEALGLSKREARELFEKLADTDVPDFELDLSKAKPADWFAERFADAVPKVDKAPTE